jgi:hypothetical protein
LEILTSKKAIAKLFCDATGIIACAFVIHHPTMENHKAPALISLVFKWHHQRLLKYSEIPTWSPQDFLDLLHEVHHVSSGVHEHMMLDPYDITAMEPTKE